MTEISNNKLIEETDELLLSIKKHYLAIAANLYRIKNGVERTEDDWVEYYKSRDLTKSAVSKFLKVGEFVIAHGFQKETVSYEQLYLSINRNPEKDPKYILAEAKTWHSDDYKAQKKEDCKEHDYHLYCSKCWSQPK